MRTNKSFLPRCFSDRRRIPSSARTLSWILIKKKNDRIQIGTYPHHSICACKPKSLRFFSSVPNPDHHHQMLHHTLATLSSCLLLLGAYRTTIVSEEGNNLEHLRNELAEVHEHRQNLEDARKALELQIHQVKKRQHQLETSIRERRCNSTNSSRPSPEATSLHSSGKTTSQEIVMNDDDHRRYVLLNSSRSNIGRGSFASVRLAREAHTEELIAIKRCLKRDLESSTELRREHRLLSHLTTLLQSTAPRDSTSISSISDDNVPIVGFKGFSDADPHYLSLAMEYLSGGDLHDLVSRQGKLSEDVARELVVQIVRAIDFLHSHAITHGDLKPENLVLDRDHRVIKLVDFGSAQMLGDHENVVMTNVEMRTTAYCPPEILLGNSYTKAADMWSIGCILFVMLCGKHPFDTSGRSKKGQIEANIVTQDTAKIIQLNGSHLSTEVKDLLQGLLTKDISERSTSQEVLDHPWIRQHTHD